MRVHLEVFEEVSGEKQHRPAALIDSETPATAVLQWAQRQGSLLRIAFLVEMRGRYRQHQLFKVTLGKRVFSVVAR